MEKHLAIQLSGHLRTFDKTYESFYKNVILPNEEKGYEIDVFVHTWDELEYRTPQWHSKGCEWVRGKKLNKDEIRKFLEKYEPKKYEITPQLKTDIDVSFDEFTGGETSFLNVINVYYTKFRVNELRLEYEKEHNIKYDWVINSRPDIFYINKFDIDEILDPYSNLLKPFTTPENKLFFAGCHRGMTVKEEMLLAASDIIYFGRDYVINKVSKIYENLDVENLKNNFHSWEDYQMFNAKKAGVTPIQIGYSVSKDWKILRLRDIKSKTKKIYLKLTRRCIQLVLFSKYIQLEFGTMKK